MTYSLLITIDRKCFYGVIRKLREIGLQQEIQETFYVEDLEHRIKLRQKT